MDTVSGSNPKIRLDTSVNPIFITSSSIKSRPDEHHDQFWSSGLLLRMMTYEMSNTENMKSILCLCFRHYKCDISVYSTMKPYHFDNETNDQVLNNVRARSKYHHYSKINDNLWLKHEHVIHISTKCVIDSTYFSESINRKMRDLLEELRSHEQVFLMSTLIGSGDTWSVLEFHLISFKQVWKSFHVMSHVVRMIDLSSHGVSSFFMMNTWMISMIVLDIINDINSSMIAIRHFLSGW